MVLLISSHHQYEPLLMPFDILMKNDNNLITVLLCLRIYVLVLRHIRIQSIQWSLSNQDTSLIRTPLSLGHLYNQDPKVSLVYKTKKDTTSLIRTRIYIHSNGVQNREVPLYTVCMYVLSSVERHFCE